MLTLWATSKSTPPPPIPSPSFSVDFSSVLTIPSEILFTRATDATYRDINDYVATAAGNEPRFQYSDGILQGLLVESEVENIVLYSELFSSWTQSNTTANLTGITSPANDLTASIVIPTITSATHYVRSNILSVTLSTRYNFSVFAKAAGYKYVKLLYPVSSGWGSTQNAIFDVSAGTLSSVSAAGFSYQIETYADGWYRISFSSASNANVASRKVDIQILDDSLNETFSGDGVKGVYLWGAQVEASDVMSSYIQTGFSTAVRTKDNLQVVSGSFPTMFNTLGSSVLVSGQAYRSSLNTVVSEMFNASIDNLNYIKANILGLGTFVGSVVSGSSQGSASSGNVTTQSDFTQLTQSKICSSFSSSAVAQARDGGNLSSSAIVSIPTATALDFCDNYNGIVSVIKVWNSTLSNAHLIESTI